MGSRPNFTNTTNIRDHTREQAGLAATRLAFAIQDVQALSLPGWFAWATQVDLDEEHEGLIRG